MGDKNGGLRLWWSRCREVWDGAEVEKRPKGLADLVRPEDDVNYKVFCETYPAQHLEMQLALGASQRVFDRATGETVQRVLKGALRNVLDDTCPKGKSDDYVRDYLQRELAEIRGWLDQDCVTAVSRGLNIGLAMGAGAGVLLLAVPLLWGLRALNHLGITLDCDDRWGLLGVFVAGGVGAFGAVLSVLVRLRGSVEQLARRQAVGKGRAPVPPRQLARRLRHEGVYRVGVGWILAMALYFLLSGGIVPVFTVPATAADVCASAGVSGPAVDGTQFWGFWCAIGFVAGFNERWAFGILRRDTASRTNKATT